MNRLISCLTQLRKLQRRTCHSWPFAQGCVQLGKEEVKGRTPCLGTRGKHGADRMQT